VILPRAQSAKSSANHGKIFAAIITATTIGETISSGAISGQSNGRQISPAERRPRQLVETNSGIINNSSIVSNRTANNSWIVNNNKIDNNSWTAKDNWIVSNGKTKRRNNKTAIAIALGTSTNNEPSPHRESSRSRERLNQSGGPM
jgi:hypothetical protein